MDCQEPLIPVFVPALAVLLFHSEKQQGAPLTHEQVLAIRDKGVCIMLRGSEAAAMAKARGYVDIDPEHVWEEWQIAREQLPPAGGQA
jgi:hypothetical protein